MSHLHNLIEKDPVIESRLDQIEKHTQHFTKNDNKDQNGNVIIIPTVFHVIHNGDAVGSGENIADLYILAQLDQMNADFRRTNTDADGTWPQAADTEIEFCLVSSDPNGNPTSGIIRHNISGGPWSDSSFDANVKPVTIWDRDNYLNVWICDLGGLLGYAQFPGGPANTDGVVNLYSAIGSIATPNPQGGNYAIGRTVTHEVGHWLNLRHIWGDTSCGGDDFVTDTPLQGTDNSTGSPCTFPGPNSCGSGPGDDPDMFQNYMDYSNDVCMNLFTEGQKTRMQALFSSGGARESLVTSSCGNEPEIPVANFSHDAGSLEFCGSGMIEFTDSSSGIPTAWSWTFSGAGVNPLVSTDQNPTINVTSSGTLTVSLEASNALGMNTKTMDYTIIVNAANMPPCAFPPVASFTPNTGPIDHCMLPMSLDFMDTSTGDPGTSWAWTFTGVDATPSSSTDQNPSITINSTGTLTASLEVTNIAGMNIISHDIIITETPCLEMCESPGLSIPDDNINGLERSFTMQTGMVVDVDVEIDISHSYVGDLLVSLEHAGVTVVLFDRPGVPMTTYGCSNNNIVDCIFDDESGAGTVEDVCDSGSPAITGTFNPEQSLTAFDGLDQAGEWVLKVVDNASGDTGILDDWCITITVEQEMNDCLTMAELTGTINSIEDYESSNFINTSQVLIDGATVDYDAVDYIILSAGFDAQLGSNFEAFIDGCNNGEGGSNLQEGEQDSSKN